MSVSFFGQFEGKIKKKLAGSPPPPPHIQIYSAIYIFFSLEAASDRLHLQFQTYTASWHVSHPPLAEREKSNGWEISHSAASSSSLICSFLPL